MRIYKYPIRIADTQKVLLPFNAEILAAQMQHGNLCLWAQVDERNTGTQERTIEVFGTGHPMDEAERRYIATTQMNGGTLVWHVFERYHDQPLQIRLLNPRQSKLTYGNTIQHHQRRSPKPRSAETL